MNPAKFTLAALAATFSFAVAASAQNAAPAAATATLPPVSTKTGVTFATDIKPIFDAACVKCHDGTKKPRAGLALDTLAGTLKGSRDGSVVKVGDSAHSDLVFERRSRRRSRRLHAQRQGRTKFDGRTNVV